MSTNGMLGTSGEDILGLLIDFATKLRSGAITLGEAKRFLRKENPWLAGIVQATPFDPKSFLGEGWTINEQDEKSLALTEIDLSRVILETCLIAEETSINTGREKLERLKAAGYIRLDARFFMALWKNKKLIPESWKGKFICFDGTILLNPEGERYVLYLHYRGDDWLWNEKWLGNSCGNKIPSAVLASSL